MIYDDQKIIFLHVPKTGGGSIELLLQNNFGEPSAPTRHWNMSRMEMVVSTHLSSYKIFVISRNPFERIASTYEHFVTHEGLRPDTINYQSFKQYMQNIRRYFNGELDTNTRDDIPRLWRSKNKDGVIVLDSQHIETMNWWLRQAAGRTMDCKILKFADLYSEWDAYKKQLGIIDSLPHINKKNRTTDAFQRIGRNAGFHSKYADYYDDETIKDNC